MDTPSLLFSLQQAYYFILCISVFYVWDAILSIWEDVEIFANHSLRFYDAIYILCRLMTAGSLVSSLLLVHGHSSNCERILLTTGWLISLALIVNSSLFFLRALAVFADSKPIATLFSILWLSTLSALTIPFGISAEHEEPWQRCNVTVVEPFTSSGFAAVVMFDTIVVLAISYQVLKFNFVDIHDKKLLARACGRGLGVTSSSLLQSGLFYYLGIIWTMSFTFICILSPESWFSAYFRFVYMICSVTTQNVLVGKAFRFLKMQMSWTNPPLFPTSFSSRQLHTLRFAQMVSDDDTDDTSLPAIRIGMV
ncbi:hypothetical protein QCA50_004074 [Cerrena zonata]|uniref:Uncharacterized protein n=1 Tax=Cerrena zonata TaxID=2478898 RepID=A0AAW0GMU4_9APHY